MIDRRCKVDGCDNIIIAKGLCSKHYDRVRRHGDYNHCEVEFHNMTNSREYLKWKGMKKRCYNKNDRKYHRYGGRGISMCNEWKNSFLAFYNDMGDIPFEGAELDRIDNDGNYESSNVRWANRTTNIRNSSATKTNMHDVYEIRMLSMLKMNHSEIGSEYGIKRSQVSNIHIMKSWKYKDVNGRYIV